jgi:hypothetical protein
MSASWLLNVYIWKAIAHVPRRLQWRSAGCMEQDSSPFLIAFWRAYCACNKSRATCCSGALHCLGNPSSRAAPVQADGGGINHAFDQSLHAAFDATLEAHHQQGSLIDALLHQAFDRFAAPLRKACVIHAMRPRDRSGHASRNLRACVAASAGRSEGLWPGAQCGPARVPSGCLCMCDCGEIGRHPRLKISCSQGRTGSSPVSRTRLAKS